MGRKGATFMKSLSINKFKVQFVVLEATIIARPKHKVTVIPFKINKSE